MSRRLVQQHLLARDELVVAPTLPEPRACEDRTFELPPVLHIVTATAFVGFVTILCLTFATPHLAVPYGVFVFFMAAFFAIPAAWARMKPDDNRSRALRWDEFMEKGIVTATGHASGREAAVLVLMLPMFILLWAVAIATVAGLVH